MKIHNINKKDLIVTEKEIEKIEITAVPIEDLENEDLSLIIALGDDDNPVDITIINTATLSMLYLLTANPQLQSVPDRIVLTVPENIPLHFPDVEQYPLDETTWESFREELDDDPDLLEENWFFISVGQDVSESELQKIYKDLRNDYPDLNGLIMRPKIAVYWE